MISGLGRVDSKGVLVEEGAEQILDQQSAEWGWVTVHTQTEILPVANSRDITAFISISRMVMMSRLSHLYCKDIQVLILQTDKCWLYILCSLFYIHCRCFLLEKLHLLYERHCLINREILWLHFIKRQLSSASMWPDANSSLSCYMPMHRPDLSTSLLSAWLQKHWIGL